MLRSFILLIFLISVQNAIAQVHLSLESMAITELKNEAKAWTVDNLGNLIVVEGNTINKYDTTGKKMFTQSVKSIGEISKIEPINTLKLLVFSEEQQCVCLLDNTLSINGKCKYLDEYGVRNAKIVATSNRPNLIWVFDQFNSSLYLIDIIQNKVIQLVENFSGLAKMKSEVLSIQEYNNHLYLSDNMGLYEFDMMLNWVNYYEIPNMSSFQLWKETAFFTQEIDLKWFTLRGEIGKSAQTSTYQAESLIIQGNHLYIKTGKRIEKILLKSQNE